MLFIWFFTYFSQWLLVLCPISYRGVGLKGSLLILGSCHPQYCSMSMGYAFDSTHMSTNKTANKDLSILVGSILVGLTILVGLILVSFDSCRLPALFRVWPKCCLCRPSKPAESPKPQKCTLSQWPDKSVHCGSRDASSPNGIQRQSAYATQMP